MVRSPARLVQWLTTEREQPERLRTSPNAWWLAVATVCFGAFMGQLDASVVTLTYPQLSDELGASLAAVQWVSLSYLLVLAALLIPVGRIADSSGRKLVYLHGFVLFTVASIACGLAPSLEVLIACRAVQGAGAAMLQANSIALVATSAPSHRLRTAFGVQAAAQALGLALGPTVGGLLVTTVGWRWVFGINVPVGVIAVTAGIFLLPRTTVRAPRRGRDGAGVALLATATTTCLLGLSAAAGLGFSWWVAPALLVVATAGAVGFVAHERRTAAPLLGPALLSSKPTMVGLLGAMAGYLVLFGPLVLVPLVLTADGRSELHAGLVLTALPAGFAVAATLGERLLPRSVTDRHRTIVGAGLAVTATTAMAVTTVTTPALPWLLATLGVALGLFTPANNTLVMRAVPADVAGTGGGLLNTARSLGTALGVAAVTLAIHLSGDRTGLWSGDRTAMLVLAAAAVVVLAAATLPSGRQPATSTR